MTTVVCSRLRQLDLKIGNRKLKCVLPSHEETSAVDEAEVAEVASGDLVAEEPKEDEAEVAEVAAEEAEAEEALGDTVASNNKAISRCMDKPQALCKLFFSKNNQFIHIPF